MKFPEFYFVFMSIMSFLIFGADKLQAKNNRSRIPENIFLIAAFFGGTFGSIIGMLIFNHKTRKRSFLLRFFIVVAIQIILIILVFTNSQ